MKIVKLGKVTLVRHWGTWYPVPSNLTYRQVEKALAENKRKSDRAWAEAAMEGRLYAKIVDELAKEYVNLKGADIIDKLSADDVLKQVKVEIAKGLFQHDYASKE